MKILHQNAHQKTQNQKFRKSKILIWKMKINRFAVLFSKLIRRIHYDSSIKRGITNKIKHIIGLDMHFNRNIYTGGVQILPQKVFERRFTHVMWSV